MQLLSGDNPTYGLKDPSPYARYVRQADSIDIWSSLMSEMIVCIDDF